jgi:hypothetical protein
VAVEYKVVGQVPTPRGRRISVIAIALSGSNNATEIGGAAQAIITYGATPDLRNHLLIVSSLYKVEDPVRFIDAIGQTRILANKISWNIMFYDPNNPKSNQILLNAKNVGKALMPVSTRDQLLLTISNYTSAGVLKNIDDLMNEEERTFRANLLSRRQGELEERRNAGTFRLDRIEEDEEVESIKIEPINDGLPFVTPQIIFDTLMELQDKV